MKKAIHSNTNFEDQPDDFYKNFLNKIIPTNREIFNLIKTDLPNKNSYDKILKSLEPFGIYENDVGFMLYRDIVLFIEDNMLIILGLLFALVVWLVFRILAAEGCSRPPYAGGLVGPRGVPQGRASLSIQTCV